MKSVCALVRRNDVSRAAFHEYYESNHAPLALQYFPFSRYVRNHLLDCPDIGFDTVSEFWWDDANDTAGLMDGSIGEIMRVDERKFMDQARIAPGGSAEHLLSSGAACDAEGRRTALLIDWTIPDTDAHAILLAWGRELAAEYAGVSADFVQSWREPRFPGRAILWLPGALGAGVPGTWAPGMGAPQELAVRPIAVRRVESAIA